MALEDIIDNLEDDVRTLRRRLAATTRLLLASSLVGRKAYWRSWGDREGTIISVRKDGHLNVEDSLGNTCIVSIEDVEGLS